MTFRHTRVVPALAAALVALTATSCADPKERFCSELQDNQDLAGLSDAIRRGDGAATQASLQRISLLADLAPPEISGDMRHLVDALSDAVRIVTRAKGPEGVDTPVDAQALSDALTTVPESSQHVREYADRECGIHLR